MDGQVATPVWGQRGRLARYIVHDCRLYDNRGWNHVFDDRDDSSYGIEPIYLAHLEKLHA